MLKKAQTDERSSCPKQTSVSALSASASACATATVTVTGSPTTATATVTVLASLTTATVTVTVTALPSATACATLPTPTVGLLYGDFECGLGLWTVDIPDPAAKASVTTTNPNTGKMSFEVDFNGKAVSPFFGESVRLFSPNVPVTKGAIYTLSFSTFFNNGAAGFIGVEMNGVPFSTDDAEDHQPVGVWHAISVNFVATAATANVTFDFLFTNGVAATDQIDSITLTLAPPGATVP